MQSAIRGRQESREFEKRKKIPRSKDAAEVALKLHFKTNCRSSKALCEVLAPIPDDCAVLFKTRKVKSFQRMEEKKKAC
ncbi:hypothetical protein DVH24_034315 [Malus domestica]|uniref:Uncharacterized protein n=1 Tax=Malus domestica TaxID=3750 RepID=A0A498IYN6_MALDO|nr:hypothetical protein DVH24_034315 [Malus domestica]